MMYFPLFAHTPKSHFSQTSASQTSASQTSDQTTIDYRQAIGRGFITGRVIKKQSSFK